MTEHAPLFSVVIPTYNREAFTLRAIESVRAQSFKDYEIIIVDDASTDRTREVVAALEYDNLRVVGLPANIGVSGARNAGVKHARGQYVVFLDSDDEMMPETLAAYYGHVCTWPDIELFWSGLERQFEDETGHVVEEDIRLVSACSYRPQFVNRMFAIKVGANSGLALKRERYLEMGGFDESFRFQEDRDLLIRALKLGLRYASVNKILIRTYKHKSHSLTLLQSNDRLRTHARLYALVIDRHRDFLSRSENKPLLLRQSEMLVNCAYKAGDMGLARKHAVRIFQSHPGHVKLLSRIIRYELKTLLLKLGGKVST